MDLAYLASHPEYHPFVKDILLHPPNHPPQHLYTHWDSGATHSTIGTTTLSLLGWTHLIETSPDTFELEDASGTIVSITQCITLHVHPHPDYPPTLTPFLVLPGMAPTLLSGAWLKQQGALLDFAQETITLAHPPVTIPRPGHSFPGHPLPLTPTHTLDNTASLTHHFVYSLATPLMGVCHQLTPPTPTLASTLLQPHPARAPLTPSQLNRVTNILTTYSHVFLAKNTTNPIPTTLPGDVYYTVELLDPTHPPQFTCRNRTQPTHLLPLIRTHIQDLLEKGKITVAMTNTPTASWASFHPKHNAEGDLTSLRMTIDYRQANSYIKSDQYPLPLNDTLITHIARFPYYIQLDLGEGYYNLLCDDPMTQRLLAFKTGDGALYWWNVCPQGSKNAPSVFQHAMEHLLQQQIDAGHARVYLDDLILGHDSIDALLDIFEEVLKIFGTRRMRFKFSKSAILVTTVTLLGRVISHNKIQVDQDKLIGIKDFGIPNNTKDVRSFCGILNWIKPHIPNISTILAPIYNLLQGKHTPRRPKTKPITWTPEAQAAFEAAKAAALSSHTLHLFTPQWETVSLHDASNLGAGAVLLQRAARQEPWHLVACWSEKFSPRQSQWHTTDQEQYAISEPFVHHWRNIIGPTHVTVYTDHEPATHLLKKSLTQLTDKESRIARQLATLNITIKHIPGHINDVADSLSRNVTHPTYCLLIIDLFAGSGSTLRAMDRALTDAVTLYYYAIDHDPVARKAIQHAYDLINRTSPGRLLPTDIFSLPQDISHLHPHHLTTLITKHNPKASISLGGPPCPPYSRASLNPRGLLDPRDGFKHLHRLHNITTYFQYENVVFHSTIQHDLDTITDWFGTPHLIDMADYSAQRRSRLIWTNLTIPTPPDNPLTWPEILEPGWQPHHAPGTPVPQKSPPILTSTNTWNASKALVQNHKTQTRAMTFTELERLIGFHPHDTRIPTVTPQQRHQLLGNSHCIHFQQALYTQLNRLLCTVHRTSAADEPHKLHSLHPPTELNTILTYFHRHAGHQAADKTHALLTQAGYVIPKISVQKFIDHCPTCIQSKSRKHTQPTPPLGEIPQELYNHPMDAIHVDFTHIGACNTKPHLDHALVAIDAYSGYTWIIPCTKYETTTSTIHLLQEHIFNIYGLPLTILSDNGPQFGPIWNEHWEARLSQPIHTTPYNSKANGKVERTHRTIKQILRSYIAEGQQPWTPLLPQISQAINWTLNSTTKHTPFHLFFTRTPHISPPLLPTLTTTLANQEQTAKHLEESSAIARRTRQSQNQKQYNTNNHTKSITYNNGDKIMIETGKHNINDREPFQPVYDGPYTVISSTAQTVTIDANGTNKTITLDKTFKAPINIQHQRRYIAREWTTEGIPSYHSIHNGHLHIEESTPHLDSLPIPELGITTTNSAKVREYKQNQMSHITPYLLNTCTRSILKPTYIQRSKKHYLIKDLENLSIIKNEQNLTGRLLHLLPGTDQFVVRYVDGTQDVRNLQYIITNLIGHPSSKNYDFPKR